jgi:hypothetical protein
MLRLSLQLTLRSGREGIVRLVITAIAVAIGVGLLLGVLAEFHAFQAQSDQRCWSCTVGESPLPAGLPAQGDLWNDSVDFYQGQTVTRLDISGLNAAAPVPPGVPSVPRPGEYYASPALRQLLKTVPADQLGDRFPGRLAGTIWDAALSGPSQLVIYIGYTPAALRALPGTQIVDQIGTAPAPQVFTVFFRYAFGVGVLALLLPIAVLIGTATRLAADRREERFAALRLVGGTPADIRSVAAVEATTSALVGTVLGIGAWLAVRPLIDGTALISSYFPGSVTPTWWEFLAMLLGVPAIASVAAVVSLRRVQISPLGTARRARPRPPTHWRLATLVTGLALYLVGLAVTTHKGIGGETYPGLILTMTGLVLAGPWFTAQAARILGSASRGPSALLATRRLVDNPRTAFRAVTGLVLAVFLGTMIGTLVPAVNQAEATPSAGALTNVLLDTFTTPAAFNASCNGVPGCVLPVRPTAAQRQVALGLPPQAGARLLSELDQFAGASAYPLYSNPRQARANYFAQGHDPGVASCAVLAAFPAFGSCPSGARAVLVNDIAAVSSDNPADSTAPFAFPSSTPYAAALTGLSVQAVLVKVDSPATLERVRTFLSLNAPPDVSDFSGLAPTPPRTYGEAIAIRAGRADLLEKLVYTAVAITLIVAGCSLAVAVGGGLVERRRPFALLRVSGTPVGVLFRVVLFEAAVPLVAATLVAAVIAYGTSVLAFLKLAPPGVGVPWLGGDYFLLMGTGLVVAFAIIAVTLPLLRRMTAPSAIRFE